MSYIKDKSSYSWTSKDPIEVKCDNCESNFSLLFKSAEKNFKKNNRQHICAKCKGQTERPQCTSSFWTKDKKEKQSNSVKNSLKYKKAIEDRDTSGENNGMFGKKHSKKTKKKMSKSRTGKLGPNATGWKGGKLSVTRRVKEAMHNRFNWYYRIYQRDNWTCQECGSKKKIDAHHIEPVHSLIKELTKNKNFNSDEEKIEWLLEQPKIKDDKLKNGKTLCRDCHKKEHTNWGSHDPKVK